MNVNSSISSQTKVLLHVFSTSPSLPIHSGPHPLFQQSSLLLRWVSKTRTREASFLLYCTLKQHPVAPRSLLVPSAVTGHRRPQTLLNLSLWCLLGFLSALQPHSAPLLSWLKPTGGSRHVNHLMLDVVKQCGFHEQKDQKKKKKKRGALPTSCILLFRALMLQHRS